MNKISGPYIVTPVLQNFPLYFKPWTTFISIEKIKYQLAGQDKTVISQAECRANKHWSPRYGSHTDVMYNLQLDHRTHIFSTLHIIHGLLIFWSPICPTYQVHMDYFHSHCGVYISDHHQHIHWGTDHTGNLPQYHNTSHLQQVGRKVSNDFWNCYSNEYESDGGLLRCHALQADKAFQRRKWGYASPYVFPTCAKQPLQEALAPSGLLTTPSQPF